MRLSNAAAIAIAVSIQALVGAGSYFLMRAFKPTSKHVLFALGAYLLITSCIDIFEGAVLLLAIGAVISLAGTWAHVKTTEKIESGWESPYHLVFLATVLSMLEFIGASSLLYAWSSQLPTRDLNVYAILDVFVMFTSSSAMPFLIWMVQSYNLRPGMDKHFED